MVLQAKDLSDLKLVAKKIIELSKKNSSIILLNGDMGSGKTTLSQQLFKLIGIKDLVTSPTYNIVNEYKKESKFYYHIDLYRLYKNKTDKTFLYDYINKKNFVIVEWPTIFKELLKLKGAVLVDIDFDFKKMVRTYKIGVI